MSETIHDLKITNAQSHIREMLQHVGTGFATQDEALADAEKTLSRSGLDDFQMAEAFRSFTD